uniref:Uncharacterized protein n=1 Tax=Oryza punctata TaxID=4537 RepID=A0A0E0JXP8_ORYPU
MECAIFDSRDGKRWRKTLTPWEEAAPSEVMATTMQSLTCWVVKGNFLFTMELRLTAELDQARR